MIIQEEPGSPPDDVSVTVAELQRIADISGPSYPLDRSFGRLRIMFVVGSSCPWRAIESERAWTGKRMMCFRQSEPIRRIMLERLEWQRADKRFVTEHMATPGNFPGITSDWVPSRSFDAVFETYRLGTREHWYHTAPDCVVNLARTT